MTKSNAKRKTARAIQPKPADYELALSGVVELLDAARRASARAVNSLMTATYWEIGRRIVQREQAGKERAAYGTELLLLLSADLTQRFGRGFSVDNLERARKFFLAFTAAENPRPRCGNPPRRRARQFPQPRCGNLPGVE